MWFTLVLVGLLFVLIGVIRGSMLMIHSATFKPLPHAKTFIQPGRPELSEHDKMLAHIDELEYELGIGPGGQRKLDEEIEAAQQVSRRKDAEAKARAEAEKMAENMSALAQTDPAEYWRRVAYDIWRRAGH